MGEQIHIGGIQSSQQLLHQAGIKPETTGVDLCCCTGAGMRFLIRFASAARMHGIDATDKMVEVGRKRTRDEGLNDKVEFTLADASDTKLPSGMADFVWGEDAWCYVEDKTALIKEAARLTRGGGTIAFTDWIEGPEPLQETEAQRLLGFMKFPNIQNLHDYVRLLETHGYVVHYADYTKRFSRYVSLYRNMLGMQLSYDALKLINFDSVMMEKLDDEMQFMQQLAAENKIDQGMFVARKMSPRGQ
jgi:SAM-dependent methyltransferase